MRLGRGSWVLGLGSLLASCVLLGGCVRRSLTITSEPPGALVYDNDALKGATPVSYDFLWYGWHRVILRKDGYERVQEHRLLRCPFYLWIPMDLVMELLPLPIRDRRTWSYPLHPLPTLPAPVPPPTEPGTPPAAGSATGVPNTEGGGTTQLPQESPDGQAR